MANSRSDPENLLIPSVERIPKGAEEEDNRRKPLLAIGDHHRGLIVVDGEIANEISSVSRKLSQRTCIELKCIPL